MALCRFFAATRVAAFLFPVIPVEASQQQFVQGHIPEVVASQKAVSRVPASTHLDLVFSLPLRHRQELTNFLRQVYQPGSPNFRHYLTPGQFAAAYGPTESDYQSVIDFAKSRGLTVTKTHPNRTLLDVNGAVRDIEKALHVHINFYQHPVESRTFYAADAQPAVDLDTALIEISGLHNYTLPRPCIQAAPAGVGAGPSQPQGGSGTNGTYMGGDFRAAYAAGVSLTGAGQSVGLFEMDGYNPGDIATYETMAHLTNPPPLQNVLVDGFSGGTGFNDGDPEVCLDIEMAVSMAPGLSNVLVYEGTNSQNDILNRMATDNAASQMSSSWFIEVNTTTDQIFQQFAAQGQTFYMAAGDSNAYGGIIVEPADDPNITVVGGTYLATSRPLGSWAVESVWNKGDGRGTGGGISQVVPIPFWQQGINMSANHGSTSRRNFPDVAMVADGVWVQVTGASGTYVGTSIAAPLWAAFTALVNEQAALNGKSPLGFANPAIYAIGKGTNYASCFHDITVGNNTSASSPSNFFAVPGYDLCTGWGTPIGSNLISALLAPQDALFITPQLGFTATGPVGGPFTTNSETYWLTNTGNTSLNWSASSTASWLSVSPSKGSLAPGGPGVAVTVSLNSIASNLLMGEFTGDVTFTNLQDNVAQAWPYAIQPGNGSFETGDFSDWTFVGFPGANGVVYLDTLGYDTTSNIYINYPFPGATYDGFVHSGLCGAYLGEPGFNASLSQTLPTVASQWYLLSCWLRSFPDTSANPQTTPNEFQVFWNGATLFDQTNMPAFGWTNLQYLVMATGISTTLEFGFRDDPAALALDDVTLQVAPTPVFQSVAQSGGSVSFSWNALPGLNYQLQFTTNLAASNWTNLVSCITHNFG